MIRFLMKGLLRDRSRSFFPLLTVFVGVLLTVALQSWMHGVMSSLVQTTAHYTTGHVRVTTRSYAKEADQVPNDLALLGIDTLIAGLRRDFPDLLWTPRTRFGGLLDVPDARHETRAQAPVTGIAADLLSPGSPEGKYLEVGRAIVRGRMLRARGEIVVGDELAGKLHVGPGDTVTLMSSTMYGSMSLTNFVVAGTVRFGIVAMDKGMIVADIADIQQALDMADGAGEILGLFADDIYHEERANAVAASFNSRFPAADPKSPGGQFTPVMGTLRTTSGLADYMDMVSLYSVALIAIFTVAMSIVLWNAGLTGSLRRYGEFGIRLAVGEAKSHVYVTLLGESVMIGLAGSLLGTAVGVGIAYYTQSHGFDIGSIMNESTMMIPNIVRAEVTPFTYVIGFLPGLLATLLGTAISGLGIYKRQTSELFKELGT
ncbi:MAG TPA: FtsX-like permease family protein [Bacteroidota bacterium]|nr:FtsX-like permease family protein [Bacteroidota bacterium]